MNSRCRVRRFREKARGAALPTWPACIPKSGGRDGEIASRHFASEFRGTQAIAVSNAMKWLSGPCVSRMQTSPSRPRVREETVAR